jgi:hypothetical protein
MLLSATTAAILGSVSPSGGTGGPIGIALGAMTFAVLLAGLHGRRASPAMHDILIGAGPPPFCALQWRRQASTMTSRIGNSNPAMLMMRKALALLDTPPSGMFDLATGATKRPVHS